MDKFKTKTIQTHDTYEAAFYILWGGRFANVRTLRLNKSRAKRKGFIDSWTITIDNVPLWAIETWRTGQAHGNISQYVIARNKLKKQIKREFTSFK